jgi:hypothetical protein
MSSFAPSISPLHPTEGIDQRVISDIPQRQRYASFCYTYQLVIKYDPGQQFMYYIDPHPRR